MTKKKLLIIVIIALISLVVGLFLLFSPSRKSESPKENKDPRSKPIINESAHLKERHCLNSLCIETMEIIYFDELGVVSIEGANNSTSPLKADYIKIVPQEKDLAPLIGYIKELAPQENFRTEIQFLDKEIAHMKNYELQALTAEERQQAKPLE